VTLARSRLRATTTSSILRGTRPTAVRAHPNAAIDEFDPSGIKGGGDRVERPTVEPLSDLPLKICNRFQAKATAFAELGLRPVDEATGRAALSRRHFHKAIK